mmetsp:Transcript_9094/g.20490  ORF Transcript_9094/g.20490 Transcript_9094/m.20490 type:complete len:312 (+) Transcript_9094:2059-2994(+)
MLGDIEDEDNICHQIEWLKRCLSLHKRHGQGHREYRRDEQDGHEDVPVQRQLGPRVDQPVIAIDHLFVPVRELVGHNPLGENMLQVSHLFVLVVFACQHCDELFGVDASVPVLVDLLDEVLEHLFDLVLVHADHHQGLAHLVQRQGSTSILVEVRESFAGALLQGDLPFRWQPLWPHPEEGRKPFHINRDASILRKPREHFFCLALFQFKKSLSPVKKLAAIEDTGFVRIHGHECFRRLLFRHGDVHAHRNHTWFSSGQLSSGDLIFQGTSFFVIGFQRILTQKSSRCSIFPPIFGGLEHRGESRVKGRRT